LKYLLSDLFIIFFVLQKIEQNEYKLIKTDEVKDIFWVIHV